MPHRNGGVAGDLASAQTAGNCGRGARVAECWPVGGGVQGVREGRRRGATCFVVVCHELELEPFDDDEVLGQKWTKAKSKPQPHHGVCVCAFGVPR